MLNQEIIMHTICALVILLSIAEGSRLIFYVNVVVLLNERDR